MSRLSLFPTLSPEQAERFRLNRNLELSLQASRVHQLLINAYPSEHVPERELERLRAVADRAMAMSQPGAKERAEAAAGQAFVRMVKDAVQLVMCDEFHSQRPYIEEGAEKVAKALTPAVIVAGVLAAYHGSLERGDAR